MADIEGLEQALGVTFKDKSMLEQALVHSSYINEFPEIKQVSNERLEFLGDAVLGLIAGEKLYADYPDCDEGEMTRLRAALVRRETLARVAARIDLGGCLYLGKGEEAGGGRTKPANLASALEAIIAAVYLDRGAVKARECVLRLLEPEIKQIVEKGRDTDYKSELQHLIQSKIQRTPSYHLVESTGPAHRKTFTVEVRLGETTMGVGSGRSKKAAETEAARVALETIMKGFTE